MILRSDTFVIKLVWKIQMGLLQPCAFLALLSFAACHCVANWKAFSFIIASVEVGSVTQLSYMLKSPGLQPFSSVPPDWSQTRCCRLVRLSNVANLSCVRRLQVVNKPGPGPHILFKLTAQAKCPVYNLDSRARNLHWTHLSGWLSDEEQMCWNWRKWCHSFFLYLMWPSWLKLPDQGDAIIGSETCIAVTVVPCLCFLQWFQSHWYLNAIQCPLQVHVGDILFL